MFFSLKKIVKTKIFNFYAKGVLKSLPVKCDGSSSVVIISQLCSRDLYMYLVALKTFTRYVAPLRVVIISDRLTEKNIDVLHQHINRVEVISISDVSTEDFPSGGTWERLLTIVDASVQNYVIQLDADTITLSEPEEVLRCIAENRSFTLGTWMGQELIAFSEATDLMNKQETKSQHVQVLAELAMAEIDQSDSLKYIRGCSGFAGFSKGESNRKQLKSISMAFEEKLGAEKWHEWGSEQIFSNIIVANSNNPFVLPIRKYSYFSPRMDFNPCHLIHFLGSNRFDGGEYAKLARSQIKLLNATPQAKK